METFSTTIAQWLPFALIIGVLLLMIVMLLNGTRITCCKPNQDWYKRPLTGFQTLRGTGARDSSDEEEIHQR
jgi:hypothetical protein